MKKIILCNALFVKRGFKKISFIIILLLMPVLCYLFKSSIKTTDITIKVGIYNESSDETTANICNNLFTKYDSIVFEKCNNIKELNDKVASGEYECGYVFRADFSEKLNSNDLNKIVDIYTSPSTLTDSLTNEYVFSEIFTEYAFNQLTDYISSEKMFDINGIDEITSLKAYLRPQYDYYLNSDDTFSFEYVNAENETIDNTGLISSYVLLSIRGIIALFIMFAAFIGTFNLYSDYKTGAFSAFDKFTRPFCEMSEIFSLTLIACLSGLIGIHISGLSDGFALELMRLLAYSIICTIYCFVLHRILPTSFAFAALIPVLVLGSIIFCPIFFDITEIIPVTKYISWIFLPKYYFLL